MNKTKKHRTKKESSFSVRVDSCVEPHDSIYKCDFSVFQQGKKTEISTKISQVKNGVTDFTAHIEAMRSTRDLKNNDIDRLQGEIQVRVHRGADVFWICNTNTLNFLNR